MNPLPITILQFGAGRFLRGFADRFIQYANDAGQNVGQVVVVQSTPGARADKLNAAADGFRVLVRGYEDSKLVERVEWVRCVRRAIIAKDAWNEVLQTTIVPSLRYIISNCTEAGYKLDDADAFDSSPPETTPAKLTRVLHERFQAKGSPLVILPCELFEQNADKMRELVRTQSRRWKLPESFEAWFTSSCLWLNNLVDCIITDPTPDLALGKEDPLLVCAEPYALWAIQRPASGSVQMFQHPAIQIVDELLPFYLRKVRMLNGLHTVMVGKFLSKGFTTVHELMPDKDASRWLRDTLFEEIVPTLVARIDGVAEFADQVWDRFRNPFTGHLLKNIAAYHEDKVRIRLQPTVEEYTRLFGKPPRRLTEAMRGG